MTDFIGFTEILSHKNILREALLTPGNREQVNSRIIVTIMSGEAEFKFVSFLCSRNFLCCQSCKEH
jgi:hypothetical protein